VQVNCTRLATWLRCPFQYWCEGQAELQPMVRPRPYMALGSIVHSALRRFYTLPPDQRTPAALFALYRQAWASKASDPAFASREDRERWYRQGYDMLRRYAGRARPAEVRVRRLECSMSLDLGEHRVTGKVDRVDDLGEGTLRVVDYKTGRTPGSLEDDVAARIYPLMVWKGEVESPPARVVMVYEYLSEGEKVVRELAPGDVAALEEEVARLLENIAGDEIFVPGENEWCRSCDFRALCPEAPLEELLIQWREDAAGKLEALTASHRLPALWTRLAQIRMFRGEYEAAAHAAARAVEVGPDYVLSRQQLGVALAILGRTAEAVQHLRWAWERVLSSSAGGAPPGTRSLRWTDTGLILAEALLALRGEDGVSEAEEVLRQLRRWHSELPPASEGRWQRLKARAELERGPMRPASCPGTSSPEAPGAIPETNCGG